MTTRNAITGDKIKSKPINQAYLNNFDRVFASPELITEETETGRRHYMRDGSFVASMDDRGIFASGPNDVSHETIPSED